MRNKTEILLGALFTGEIKNHKKTTKKISVCVLVYDNGPRNIQRKQSEEKNPKLIRLGLGWRMKCGQNRRVFEFEVKFCKWIVSNDFLRDMGLTFQLEGGPTGSNFTENCQKKFLSGIGGLKCCIKSLKNSSRRILKGLMMKFFLQSEPKDSNFA